MEILEDIKLVNLICIVPIVWGIWEFRQFRKEVTELNKKIDNIMKNELEDYPFLKETKDLLDNLNQIFYLKKNN